MLLSSTFKNLKVDTIDSQQINMHSGKITNVAPPTNPTDVATKSYVDNSSGGGGEGDEGPWKATVQVCATQDEVIGFLYENDTITWPEDNKTTLNGVVLVLDMRVLIAYSYGEYAGSPLGIYVVSELEPTVLVRSADAQNGTEAAGTLIYVSGTLGFSEAYAIFLVPTGDNRVWGDLYMDMKKYSKLLVDGYGSHDG